ncbi:hypothetical protein DM01DRAFT_1195507 [Hesseltinella vesiculosa]|uniref:Uncharacterized protein n=1 Tax=Hesseltinella vesiculosa TaxID=101127 RepID=A0A1X2G3H5_9FUNG|nr:hypothetical protein DM01DRAFT_1195507 [Hesseltinella vesiculosa]
MPIHATGILPEYACRNKSVLQNGCVPGLPPPYPPLKDDLLTWGHIQHLAACHFGQLQKDPTSKHPAWSYLDIHRAPAPLNPLVTAKLQSIYNTKLTTDMKNLMSRSCFKKMVHSLLRLFLQCHLAPRLEQQ